MDEVRLGSLTLQPRRQLMADGERVPLGRRALEIVSVLAEAGGGIVTKDELFAAVWPGVIVEENALQVHIVALRKALGSDAERLKTIRGVGYQLDVADDIAPKDPQAERTQTADLSHPTDKAYETGRRGPVDDLPASTDSPQESSLDPVVKRARTVPLQIAALVAVVLALLVWLSLRQFGATTKLTDQPIQVATFAAQGGPQAVLLAVSVKNTAQQILGDTNFRSRPVDAPTGNRGFALKGSVIASGGRLTIFEQIEHMPTGETVWSHQFEDDPANADHLATTAVVAAAESLNTARDAERQKGLTLGPKDIARMIEGSNLISIYSPIEAAKPLEIFQDLAARVPGSAQVHAMLALSLLRQVNSPSDANSEAVKQVRSEAEKAIRIDPEAAGAAFDALYGLSVVLEPKDLAKQQDVLLDGLRQAPAFAFLSMRECDILLDVGRVKDALPHCLRAIAMRPTAAPIAWRVARAYAVAGQWATAEEASERAERYYPEALSVLTAKLGVLAFGHQPERAFATLRILHDQSEDYGDAEIGALEQFLRARTGKENPVSAAEAIRSAAQKNDLRLDFAVGALATLGQTDDALGLLALSKSAVPSPLRGRSFLYQPATAPLRHDPRFWKFAADQGLVAYWTKRGIWPDFCGVEMPLADCMRLAAQAGKPVLHS